MKAALSLIAAMLVPVSSTFAHDPFTHSLGVSSSEYAVGPFYPLRGGDQKIELTTEPKNGGESKLKIRVGTISKGEQSKFYKFKTFWGCDCSQVNQFGKNNDKVIKEFSLTINGKKVSIPFEAYGDILHLNLEISPSHFIGSSSKKNTVYFLFKAGDGAGSASGRYTITDHKIVKREIRSTHGGGGKVVTTHY